MTWFLTATGNSSAYDLKRKVMKLIFEGEVMRPVTSNVHLFISVMDMFTLYEKSVSNHYFKFQENASFSEVK